jgi:hypothetical protein
MCRLRISGDAPAAPLRPRQMAAPDAVGRQTGGAPPAVDSAPSAGRLWVGRWRGDFVSERIDDASDGRQGQWQEEKEWEWIGRQRLCMLLTMRETRFQSCIKVYNFYNGVKYRSASISECTYFDIGMSVVRCRSTL